MAEDTATKALIKEMKDDRKKTVKALDGIIKEQKKNLEKADKNTEKGRKEAKAAASKQLKAAKARDALLKQDISVGADLKKNFKDIGTSITGGLEGMMSETFGPLGGIAASLTTGFFKRDVEAKKNLESDQMQVDSTDQLVEELTSKKTGGKVEKVTAESAEETAGGVQDVGDKTDFTNELLINIDDNLQFMTDNMEDRETREERLRALKAKKAGGAVAGAGGAGAGADGSDGEGIGVMDVFGGLWFVKKMKDALIAMRTLFGKGFFGKGGLFRNLKAAFIKQFQKIFGKGALRTLMKGMKLGARFSTRLVAFAGSMAAALIAPVIDGIFGFIDAEKWGVSKTSGVLGGILGGSEGGFMNAFMNAGKWALIGVKIGAIGGPPGMIAGGLIGAAIGGLLGWIGGDVIAQKLDAVGAWFGKQWDNVVQTLKDAWLAVMPKWFTEIDFEWSDILPPGLSKLFNGEYFTVDFPEFTWQDLMPKFLKDFFQNLKIEQGGKDFEWKDLMPPFLKKFFAGTYAIGKEEFEWRDLLPPFIKQVIAGFKVTAAADWSWHDLLPEFLVKLATHDYIKPTGTFEWKDLVPTFISKIIDAGKAAGTTETGEFDWTRLLPSWMGTAWGAATEGVAKIAAGEFDWKALLPDWMIGAWASTEGIIKRDVGGFDWTRLLPSFMADLFPGMKPVTINKALAAIDKFDWTLLLPDFIADILRGKKKQLAETASLAFDWWKSLLPDWIVNVMEGKSPFAEREPVDEKVVAEKKEALDQSVSTLTEMPDFGGMFNVWPNVREKISSLMNPEDAPFGTSNVVGWMRDKLLAILPTGEQVEPEKKAARGGVIVNRPAYLPKSGVIVGEHPSWSGRGAYAGMAGGVPDGGRELVTEGGSVIPLEGGRGGQLVANALAAPIAGAVMNSLAHDAIGLRGGAGQTQSSNIVDASTNTNVTNNTIIRTPSPSGPSLHFEGRDFVHKIA